MAEDIAGCTLGCWVFRLVAYDDEVQPKDLLYHSSSVAYPTFASAISAAQRIVKGHLRKQGADDAATDASLKRLNVSHFKEDRKGSGLMQFLDLAEYGTAFLFIA